MNLKQIVNRCIDVCVAIAGTLLALQFMSISADVLLRYFIEISLDWVIYSNEWSLFFITFLGAAWLQREDGHVRMDLLFIHLGKHLQLCIDIVSDALALIIGATLLWFGSVRTLELFDSGIYDFFKVDYVPLYLIYLVVPIGSFLLCVQALLDLVTKTGISANKTNTP